MKIKFQSVATPEVAESLHRTPSSGIEPTVDLSANETEFFSSDQLALCFSYPQEYTQISFDAPIVSVGIASPDLPDPDTKARLSLEIRDAYNRTDEEIADKDMTYAVDHAGVPLENLGRWILTLGGEKAVVLDGMSVQDIQLLSLFILHVE